MRYTDVIALIGFTVMNMVALLAFAWDKWQAGGTGRRIPEFTLVLIAALGGWPGGWLGMKLFHHKTAKGIFQLKFAGALIPFVAEVFIWLHWR